MKKKKATDQAQTVSGVITSVSVSGLGPNSAEIVVSINSVDGVEAAYAVYAYPSTEPSVFTSFASILMAAYINKTKIDLSYVPGQGVTPQIYQLVCPSGTP